jgi:hypothetical protein
MVPFLVFWCLGSFALGAEMAQVPLASLVSAVERPLHAAATAQGALAHVSQHVSDVRRAASQVATGILGRKPTSPHVQKKVGKGAHKTKQAPRTIFSASARYGDVGTPGYWGSAWHWDANRGAGFTAGMPGSGSMWGGRDPWPAQGGWRMAWRDSWRWGPRAAVYYGGYARSAGWAGASWAARSDDGW